MSSSDITVKQSASLSFDAQQNMRRSPTYLVVLEDGKKDLLFVATKYENETAQAPKFTGFYATDCTQDKITADYDELLKATDKSSFVEMHFPWHRIRSVKNLVFRQK